MTTETPSKNTATTDNKVIFAPLGKYAVIAVIMVSIIVTTAIMLDKQFNTIDQQVAKIEAEVAKSNAKKLKSSEDTALTEVDNIAISAIAEPQTSAAVEVPTADVLIASKTKHIAVTDETQKDSNLVVESTATTIETTKDNTVEINTETTLTTSTSVEQIAQASPIAAIKQAHTDRQATLADRNKAREDARQVRIEAFKLEQKKHMTELFARIKVLESKQLEQYRTSQQHQVVSLREQVARQQKMIEALVLRNKDLYKLRSANTQRNQSNRERILDRI
ncbi:MAG: hypothetical protein COA54_08465 [Thiotrichaceae bacterium]|nr:MAG: hypothetical protein COA54_08465 [Thiotrichaceae bacterium]